MSTQNDQILAAAAQAEQNFAAVAAKLTQVVEGIKALDTKITDLEAQLAKGNALTSEETAALASLVSDSGKLVTQASGIDTTVPMPAPAPTTPTT